MPFRRFFTTAIVPVLLAAPLPVQAENSAGSEILSNAKSVGIPFDNSGRRVPKWSGGALLVVDDTNEALAIIRSFGTDGSELSQVQFAIPGSSRVGVNAIARGADGRLALVGSAYAADALGARYLSVVSAGGQQQQLMRVNPFYPVQVTIAADGTLWAAGIDEGNDYNVIRRFDIAKGRLGSFIPKSSLKLTGAASDPADDSFLAASNDRVGWYSNAAREYIEFSLDGSVVTRVAGLNLEDPSRVDGIGLCDNNAVYVSVYPASKTEKRSAVFVLARSSGTWQPAARTDDSLATGYSPVYGCDGENVVTRTKIPGQLLGLTWWRPVSRR